MRHEGECELIAQLRGPAGALARQFTRDTFRRSRYCHGGTEEQNQWKFKVHR